MEPRKLTGRLNGMDQFSAFLKLRAIENILNVAQPYPGDHQENDIVERFHIEDAGLGWYRLWDANVLAEEHFTGSWLQKACVAPAECELYLNDSIEDLLVDTLFDIHNWYAKKIFEEDKEGYEDEHASPSDDNDSRCPPPPAPGGSGPDNDTLPDGENGPPQPGGNNNLSPLPWSDADSLLAWSDMDDYGLNDFDGLSLSGVQVLHGALTGLQCNTAAPQDFLHVVPKPVVVVVNFNGHPARALLDSGSVGDFMSSTLADQLKVLKIELAKPLPLQLAVQGSHSKVNFGTKVNIKYQHINEEQYLDIANLSGYDLILRTPWWFQHGVSVGFNPAWIVIKHDIGVPIQGDDVSKISACAVEAYEDQLQ
ncbi:hypothetical protein DXG01_014826 [Tephrocybe rancida]|nr:hypothetical protein DXG01_014826 [Tephrocybe rancida]